MHQDTSGHIIKRQIVELNGLRKEDAQQVQQQLAELVRVRLIPLLDQYLTALSPNGSVLRLDTLELDLGVIPMDTLESGLLERVDLQLGIQLARLAPLAEQTAAPSTRPPATRRELLHFFVHTGNLPWWADSAVASPGQGATPADPVAESLEYLLKEAPLALASDLREWVTKEAQALRLIRHLPDEMLIRTAALRVQLPGNAFAGAVAGLLRLFPHTADFTGQPLHRVRELVFLKLLQIAFSTPDPMRDIGAFWEAWLLQIAVALRVKYKLLLQTLSQAVGSDNSGFSVVLHNLQAGKTDERTQVSALEQLIGTLGENLLTVPHWPATPGEAFRQRQSDKSPVAALAQLEDALVQALAKKETIGPALIEKWVAILGRLLRDTGLPKALRTTLAATKNRLQAPGFSPAELPALLAQIARAEAEAGRLPEIASPEAASMAFSEAGELFVENAGLVILWPFLTRFFKGLELLENNRFKDAAAAHRAARLLQYLADGRPEAPEYRMALNKIICGLDWDTVLDPGPPLSETETEECEALLQAVIANAPVLRNMRPDGLRGSFLLRKGLLRPVPGAWELRVEKATHDVVLERFSWTWSVVKLPWLEGVLAVEW